MKQLIAFLSVAAILSCSSDIPIEKSIKQEIDRKGMGMVKIKQLSKPEKINDSTYSASHIFFNDMVEKEMRVTNTYYFTSDLSSIKKSETNKTEMKSEGEFIDTGF